MKFTLKQKPLTYSHLEDFVACFNPANRHVRTPTWNSKTQDGRWRAFAREELLARDKASLDVFWLRDVSMTDLENLRFALANFEAVSTE